MIGAAAATERRAAHLETGELRNEAGLLLLRATAFLSKLLVPSTQRSARQMGPGGL